VIRQPKHEFESYNWNEHCTSEEEKAWMRRDLSESLYIPFVRLKNHTLLSAVDIMTTKAIASLNSPTNPIQDLYRIRYHEAPQMCKRHSVSTACLWIRRSTRPETSPNVSVLKEQSWARLFWNVESTIREAT